MVKFVQVFNFYRITKLFSKRPNQKTSKTHKFRSALFLEIVKKMVNRQALKKH